MDLDRVQSTEESRLLAAFRADPEPFRRVLYGESVSRDEPRVRDLVIGPRDIIDVTVSGGRIAFYGKRRDYEPASVRLQRGETQEIIFGRHNSAVESRVQVSYLADGLHFDIPERYGGSVVAPRGLIVIGESKEWNTGEPIPWKGRLDQSDSLSKAEDIKFTIRYIAR